MKPESIVRSAGIATMIGGALITFSTPAGPWFFSLMMIVLGLSPRSVRPSLVGAD